MTERTARFNASGAAPPTRTSGRSASVAKPCNDTACRNPPAVDGRERGEAGAADDTYGVTGSGCRDRVRRAGPAIATIATAITHRRMIVITVTLLSPVTAGRAGRHRPD